jgi:hypothetical protein
MKDQKRKSGLWHHRIPDYKLVYCGKNESFPEKTIELEKKKSSLLQKHVLTKNRIHQKKLD